MQYTAYNRRDPCRVRTQHTHPPPGLHRPLQVQIRSQGNVVIDIGSKFEQGLGCPIICTTETSNPVAIHCNLKSAEEGDLKSVRWAPYTEQSATPKKMQGGKQRNASGFCLAGLSQCMSWT